MEDNETQKEGDIDDSCCGSGGVNDSGVKMEDTFENAEVVVKEEQKSAAACVHNDECPSSDFKENRPENSTNHCIEHGDQQQGTDLKEHKKEMEVKITHPLSTEFMSDQLLEDNFTDLDLICCDGYIPVHRCLLMGASEFLRNLLIDKDIMNTTAITLPDISVQHLKQVLKLLYLGESVIDKCDEEEVHNIITMLQLPPNNLWSRTVEPIDRKEVIELRHISYDFSYQDQDVSNEFLSGEDQESEQSTSLSNKATANSPKEIQELDSERSDSSSSAFNEDGPESSQKTESSSVQNRKCKKSHNSVLRRKGSESKQLNAGDQVQVKKEDQVSRDDNKCDDGIRIRKAKMAKSAKRKMMKDQDQTNEEDKFASSIAERLRKRVKNSSTNKKLLSAKKKAVGKLRSAKDSIGNKLKKSKSGNVEKDLLDFKPSNIDDGNESMRESNHQILQQQKQQISTKNIIKIDKEGSENKVDVIIPLQQQEQQRRLSSASSISTKSNESKCGTSSSRVFLEVKEISGVKYNIYGLLDPVNGVQSGKTIAILASRDKSK